MEEEPLFKTNIGKDAMNIASQLELNMSSGWRVERNDTLFLPTLRRCEGAACSTY
jgi:hypothetical protein